MRYKFRLSIRTSTSLHSTSLNFLPDLAFVTCPSLSNLLGPWYAVGAVRSSRLSRIRSGPADETAL
jgi:hypothetical protein